MHWGAAFITARAGVYGMTMGSLPDTGKTQPRRIFALSGRALRVFVGRLLLVYRR